MQRNFGKIIAARSISAAAGQQASRLACITPMRDIRVTGKEETDGIPARRGLTVRFAEV